MTIRRRPPSWTFDALVHPQRLAQAQELAVAALYDAFGPDDPRYAIELARMGTLMRGAGEFAPATFAGTNAYTVLASALGTAHPQTLAAATELGLTQLAAGRLTEGERHLASVYEQLSALDWAPPSLVAGAAGNLALALRARGDLAAALELQLEAARIARDHGGDDDAIIRADANLAALLGAAGRHDEALELLTSARDRYSADLGEWHPATLGLEANLGVAYREAGEAQSACGTLDRVHSLLEGQLGSEHPSTLGVAADLAVSLGASDDPADGERAVDLGRQVVAARTEQLGHDHPQTVHAMRYLARAASEHEPALALQLGEDAANLSANTLGRGHPDTLHAFDEFAQTLERRGDADGARSIREHNRALIDSAGIVGSAPPPIENLAGAVSASEAFVEGDFTPVPAAGAPPEARTDIVARTAHAELDPPRDVHPGERFALVVYLGPPEEDGPGSAPVVIEAPTGVDQLALVAWLIASRHFEIIGKLVLPLMLDRRVDESPRLRFDLHAAHAPDAFEEPPELRVRLSYNGWPCGEVQLLVPLTSTERVG